MKIYLIRHSDAVEQGTPGYEDDRLRPLTEKGCNKTKKIASALKELGVKPDKIVSSPYIRAKQTAEILAKKLKYKQELDFSDMLVPMGNVENIIGEINEKYSVGELVIVGHEPCFSMLIGTLVAGILIWPSTLRTVASAASQPKTCVRSAKPFWNGSLRQKCYPSYHSIMTKETNPSPPNLFLNRELSLLEFQRRVLDEALDDGNPLLERLKYLCHLRLEHGRVLHGARIGHPQAGGSPDHGGLSDGLTPPDVLAATRKVSLELYGNALHFFNKKLVPGLDKAGVHLLNYHELSSDQLEKVNAYFNEVVYPVLTPLALDPGHPFPHISNLSLNLAIVVRNKKGHEKFARLKVPDTLPRLMPIKRSSGATRKDGTIPHHHYFVWLEQVIMANLDPLFPGMETVSAHPFRIIRDADVEIQELEADDLLETMQQSIRKRKFGSVVQVEIYDTMPQNIRDLLIENLEIRENDVYVLPAPLGLSSLWQVYGNVERHDLKFPVYHPSVPKVLEDVTRTGDIFALIRKRNILLHHPYNSFGPVIDFLKAAARDPNVLAIKQTLYRVGQNAPVVEILLEASERGKQVAVLVELKARFDEESNIGWAKMLEEAGVHVVYGLVGLKTHSKVTMVVRKEGEGIHRYLHLGTGNYNTVTARVYEDIGIFTCDEAISSMSPTCSII